jgi:hypothetical protein
VLVLVDVLTLMLTLVVVSGVVVVVVVVVDSVVVVVVLGSVAVVDGVTVSVTVRVDGATVADVVVSGVNDVCSPGDVPPVISFARPNTIRAITTAPIAPNATRAAGLRYHGTGSSTGGPKYCVGASLG